MMVLDETLKLLEEADERLANTADLKGLEEILDRRGKLIQEAAGLLAATPRPSQRHLEALTRSHSAYAQAARSLILARHMIATELAEVNRQQHLLERLAHTRPSQGSHVDLQC